MDDVVGANAIHILKVTVLSDGICFCSTGKERLSCVE
jgi:hypothetical protein